MRSAGAVARRNFIVIINVLMWLRVSEPTFPFKTTVLHHNTQSPLLWRTVCQWYRTRIEWPAVSRCILLLVPLNMLVLKLPRYVYLYLCKLLQKYFVYFSTRCSIGCVYEKYWKLVCFTLPQYLFRQGVAWIAQKCFWHNVRTSEFFEKNALESF